ncbi:MAG: hypothetical protein IJR80_02180 [Treponema sp.]|nr:hypothetical protein [Treponema sp.]
MKNKKVFKNLLISLLFSVQFFSGCSKKSADSLAQKTAKKDSLTQTGITVGFSIDTLAMERWQRDLDVFMNTVNEL